MCTKLNILCIFCKIYLWKGLSPSPSTTAYLATICRLQHLSPRRLTYLPLPPLSNASGSATGFVSGDNSSKLLPPLLSVCKLC